MTTGPIPIPRSDLYSPQVLAPWIKNHDWRALWVLLSLHHYGWRAHADIGLLLLEVPSSEPTDDPVTHAIEHRVMAAFEELFLLIDQIWRTVQGIQAHRSGTPFLDGYLKGSYKLDRNIRALTDLTEAKWAAIFALPDDATIRQRLAATHRPEEVSATVEFAHKLTALAAKNMREIAVLFERSALTEPVRNAHSLRDVEDRYRHGMVACYEDCSPEPSDWRPVRPEKAGGFIADPSALEAVAPSSIFNVLMDPALPDDPAYFAGLSTGPKMRDSLRLALQRLSSLLHRIVVGFLSAELPGFGPPLAALEKDLEWSPLSGPQRANPGAGGRQQ